jgi:hypothetical protein
MAKVEITEEALPESPITAVLKVPAIFDGPSVRGSTYWSRLLTCPREARLAELLAPLRIDIALSTGFAWHYALELFYDSLLLGATFEAACDAAVLAIDPMKTAKGYGEMYETVMRMLVGYFIEYKSDAEKYQICAVEETLGVDSPMEYTARLDTVVKNRQTGAIHPLEHKSAKALNKSILEGYQLSLQILGQAYLFAKCVDTKQMDGVLSHVIVSVTTKQVTPQFQRVPVLPSPEHLRAFEKSIITWQALRSHVERLNYPPNFSACAGYARGYSKCRFYAICSADPDIDLHGVEEKVHRALGEKEPDPRLLPAGFVPVSALTRYIEERSST